MPPSNAVLAHHTEPGPAPLLNGVQVAADRLGVSRMSVYRLFERGELPSVKVGGRRMVAEADLLAYVERLRIGA